MGLQFFDDPGFKRDPAGGPVITFGHAAWNAWMLGQANLARARNEQMIAAANVDNPYYVAISGYHSAAFQAYLREFNGAEALAVRSIEV